MRRIHSRKGGLVFLLLHPSFHVKRKGEILRGKVETYSDDLDTDETADFDEIWTSWDTEQESYGVHDISEDQFDGEIVVAIQVQVATEPGKKTVDERDECNDAEQRGQDHRSDLQTEPGSVGERMKRIGSLVRIIVRNDDLARCQRLFFLGIAHLGCSERSGNGHDTRRDQSLWVQSHTNVCHQDRSCNRGESRAHDLMQLAHGQMWHEWLDQHGRFSLSNERRSGSDNGLGSGDSHGPEEEDGELADEPLDQTDVVEQLYQRHEEDDGWEHCHQEPGSGFNPVCRSQECQTVTSKPEQRSCETRNEVENVITDASSQDKQRDDELDQEAGDDGMPVDLAPVPRRGVQASNEDDHAKERDCAVLVGVCRRLRAGECAHEDSSRGDYGTSPQSEPLWNHIVDSYASLIPCPMHGHRHE